MKNSFYLCIIFMISSIGLSQEISNEFMKAYGVNLELGKEYDSDYISTQFPYKDINNNLDRFIDFKNSKYFEKGTVVFNSDNILTEVRLFFKEFKKKEMLDKELKNIFVLIPNMQEQFKGFQTLESEDERVYLMTHDFKSHFSTNIYFKLTNTTIQEKYDKFEKVTILNTESSGNLEYFFTSNIPQSSISIKYFATIAEDNKVNYFARFDTKNDTWKFFEEIHFLIDDNKVIKKELNSKNEVTKNGETIELFTLNLDEVLISELIKSEKLAVRFIGKDIEDTNFNRNYLKPLEILINNVNIRLN